MTHNVSTFRHVAHNFERKGPPGGTQREEHVAGAGPQEFLGRIADEHLLSEHSALPGAVARPAPILPNPRRRWIVGVGATLTGVTLVGGIALIVAALVGIIASGFGALEIAALAIGIVLVATHWGWVHVAELTAMTLEGRQERAALERTGRWLAAIEPYTRYEVSTHVGEDGAITIARTRHRPVPSGEGRFKFVAEVEHSEVHSGDEPGAVVAERAEALRRQAELDTDRERQGWAAVAGERETEQLRREQEERLKEALRAESQALSERINENLRDPPLGQ
ncbi:MAG TPA: hypothetical protein VGL78_17200 [Solirubrobacteraceae bacterium]|jgi:hypothetical protein